MTTFIVKTQQSLFDIATYLYGDVEGVFWILEDNPQLIGLTDRIKAGDVLNVRDQVINPRQVAYLQQFPEFQTIEESDKPEGINYWLLEEYVVQ
ncbi:hypothetical protein [Spirosoma aerolatum]|uniref:hypothetical protein n=1 Tax=Spirosoma aerolatum TaxID=1211326 RepID=UPI0009ACED06|nr:hypothetical protein [Spirosoma aerolatum]